MIGQILQLSDYCELCNIPYNYILHFESLQQEERHLIEILHAENVLHQRWENVYNNQVFGGQKVIAEKYFSLLDKSDIDNLYEIYKEDFLMFGYNLDNYI